MGTFSVKLQVWNPMPPGDVEQFEALVDPRSTFSWISRARLERLSVKSSRKMGLRLKNGSIVERDMASVYIAIEGNPVGDVVVMAEAGESEVMGVHTIDGFGMAADPVQKRLVSSVMWALSSHRVDLASQGMGQ
jgi:predicted aspartyl protease